MRTWPEGLELAEVRGGGTLRPPGSPESAPGDHPFHMEGPRMLRLARRYAAAFLEELRPGLSRSAGGLRLIVSHQPSAAGLAMLSRFGWPENRVVRTLEHLGNCVAASLPLTLVEAARSGRLARGDEILLVGTGAGVSLGGMFAVY